VKIHGIVIGAVLAIAGLSVVPSAQAGFSTQGFADIGTPTANTGNINTATVFTIGDLISTTANTGIFAGLPTQVIGPVTFDSTVGSSLSFSSSGFGSFTSTSITEISNSSGQAAFYVLGNFLGGADDGGAGSNGPASFTISFTQTPSGSGSISDSGTFSVPPAGTVPEPSSIVCTLIGIGSFAGVGLVRRKRKSA
jgi:hypothetical protein